MLKAILLDFAGVVTTKRCFATIAGILEDEAGADKDKVLESMREHYMLYMHGRKTTEQFWKETVADLGVSLDHFKKVFATWFELNEKLLDWAESVKDEYKVILVSDNFPALSPAVRKNERLLEVFDSMYFSDELGVVKKDKGIFEKVLKAEELEPEQCIFTDDKEKNLVAPSELGIHTMVFDGTESFVEKVSSLS